MNGYTFALTCPACGGEMRHVTNGKPSPCDVRAIVHCDHCNRDGLVVVVVTMAFKPDRGDMREQEHGTTAGYAKHRYYGQEPCDACRIAHADYMRPRNAARKQAKRLVDA